MSDNYQIQREILEDQLRWCKERDDILAEIELKLYEMKSIAEYAYEEKLSSGVIGKLNERLADLKGEVLVLENQLNSDINY
ncbi:hypothetical protein [Oceanobacillus sp. CAU 1775]